MNVAEKTKGRGPQNADEAQRGRNVKEAPGLFKPKTPEVADEKANEKSEQKKPSRFSKMKGLVASLMVAGTIITAANCGSEDETLPPSIPECTEDAGCGVDGGVSDGGADSGPVVDGGDGGGPVVDGGDGGYDAGPDVDAGDGGDGGGPVIQEDGGTDAGPVACVTASTGSFNDILPLSTPTLVGGYVFVYEGETGAGDARVSISCGGAAVGTGPYTCPEDAETTIDLPVDGKRITLYPKSCSPGATNIEISVADLPGSP